MIITTTDLQTLIYPEILEEITRDTPAIIDACILRAQDEAKAYLSRYDLLAMFGDADTEPTYTDNFLKDIVIKISGYNIVKLANPNISYEMMRQQYEDAVDTLKRISRGDMTPQGWPLFVQSSPAPEGNGVSITSNNKRNNYF